MFSVLHIIITVTDFEISQIINNRTYCECVNAHLLVITITLRGVILYLPELASYVPKVLLQESDLVLVVRSYPAL